MRKLIIVLLTGVSFANAQAFKYIDSCKKYDYELKNTFKVNAMWQLLPESYWRNDSNKYKSFYRIQLEVFQNFKLKRKNKHVHK